jgi:hypothetical protein
MSSNYTENTNNTPAHFQTTSDGIHSSSTVGGVSNSAGFQQNTSDRFTSSSNNGFEQDATDPNKNRFKGNTTDPDAITSQRQTSTMPTQPTTENYSDESNPLQSHHRPSLSAQGGEGAEPLAGEESIGHYSKAGNAPGKLGERGENIVGALGFGGSKVERPKEDQGIGEKIAEFLGA